ncbi:MAG: lysylphosphatidylglycerol synthase transmembrane domain-containing protein [Candidatus Bathyarchaeia archaeon]|jgi:uncharacterized protein (TIRG00374 family)
MLLGGRKSIIFMTLGLAAFILYLWFFVGFDGLFTLLSRLNVYQYTLFFSLAILALFLGVFFDSMIWHSLLNSLKVKVKAKKIMLYNWIGNFVELILPGATVGGEVARIALAQKETSDTGKSAASVVGSRLISTFVYSGGLLLGFFILLFSHQLPVYLITPVVLVILGTAIMISAIFLIALKDGAVNKVVSLIMWVAKKVVKKPEKQQSLQQKLHNGLASFSEAFKTFKAHPRSLIKPSIFAVTAWLFNLTVYLMIFYALDFTAISLLDLATVYCIITTVETVTAGFPVGAVEVTMVSMFSIYGVPLAVAGAVTTLSRLLTFWSQIIVGYPLAQWVGAKSLFKGQALFKLPTIKPAITGKTVSEFPISAKS